VSISLISRTRHHHALEHATIQILNRRYPNQRFMGWSTPGGFYLYGHAPTAAVRSAVANAVERLRNGEHHLAVHPRCGTNIVTAGTLVGVLSFLTMLPGDNRSRRGRLGLLIMLSTLTLILSQPLGRLVQEHLTTDPNLPPGAAAQITAGRAGDTPVHKVQLVQGA